MGFASLSGVESFVQTSDIKIRCQRLHCTDKSEFRIKQNQQPYLPHLPSASSPALPDAGWTISSICPIRIPPPSTLPRHPPTRSQSQKGHSRHHRQTRQAHRLPELVTIQSNMSQSRSWLTLPPLCPALTCASGPSVVCPAPWDLAC